MDITIHSIIENLDESGLPADEPEISITTLPVTLSRAEGELILSYSEEQEGTKI